MRFLGDSCLNLDAVDSKLQHLPVITADFQPFGFLSQAIRRTSPHRGWIHSLRGLAIISVLLAPAIGTTGIGAWIVFVSGSASHLLADMMNPSGIPLFIPQQRRRHILPPRWRIPAGSPEEDLVFVVFACLALALLLNNDSDRVRGRLKSVIPSEVEESFSSAGKDFSTALR